MSDGVLSQEEINALLGMGDDEEEDKAVDGPVQTKADDLTEEEKDAIGEIGNISMGTSATTLFTLLNQKVSITTPRIKVWTWEEFANNYSEDIVAINVDYKEGFSGTNLLLLKEEDVKRITDIMMGGDGTDTSGELTDIHLSAIAEAMNQMVGSASTSMSQMLDMKVDINPPRAVITKLEAEQISEEMGFDGDPIVQVAFSMKVGTIIDSEIMQILPVGFAKEMVKCLLNQEEKTEQVIEPITPETKKVEPIQSKPSSTQSTESAPSPSRQPQVASQANYQQATQQQPQWEQDVDIQKPQFPAFDDGYFAQQKENMDIIKDVPLEVTVELGRTSKKIKEILEFNPGTIIELDRLAGEPIDILVNGKFIAEGEVVVIDENFGIRITEIINPEFRV